MFNHQKSIKLTKKIVTLRKTNSHQSINQSINQSVSQSVNPSINQPLSCKVLSTFDLLGQSFLGVFVQRQHLMVAGAACHHRTT